MQLWQRYSNYILLPSTLSSLFTRKDALLITVSCIVPNIFDFYNDQLTEILLYGKEDLGTINNTSILDGTINYLTKNKRFDG